MRPARVGGGALFIAALMVGSALEPPTHAPIFDDGYWILVGDFHVHAAPGDVGIAPWDLRRLMGRHGLDVIAITNHNQTLAGRLGAWVSRRFGGPIMIAGEEITSGDFHLIAVGITRTVSAAQPADIAIADVHAQGGVAIAAHPVKRFWNGFNDRALTTLDGFELAHPLMQFDTEEAEEIRQFGNQVRARNPDVALIGSSDFHAAGTPGWCRTYVLATAPSEAGVLAAIRHGRTVAADVNGMLHGQPQWVQRVERHHLRERPRAQPLDDVTALLVMAVAWLGLVGLLVLA